MRKCSTHWYITGNKPWIWAKGKQEEITRSICTLSVKISSQSIEKTVPLIQDSFGASPSPLKCEFSRAKKRWKIENRLV